MKIAFEIELFADRHPRRVIIARDGKKKVMGLAEKESRDALLLLLEALVNINRIELRQNKIPLLYQAGVRYVREKTEIWRDVVTTYDDGCGDCEDLACWRVAELRNQGKRASPYLIWRHVGNTLMFHVVVLRANGTTEDPSRKLGMGKINA